MDRVLASTQRWIGQTASIDALNCDIGADREFWFNRDTSAPRPDEGRGGSSHTTNSSPEANMVEVGNDEAFVTLLASGTVPTSHQRRSESGHAERVGSVSF